MENTFEEIKKNLIEKLEQQTSDVTDYLESEKNVYRIDTDVKTNEEIFIQPAIEKLRTSELIGFDVYQDRRESVSLLTDENKLSNLANLTDKFANSQTTESNIFINHEKIKYFYITVNQVVLVYRYTSKAYLKAQAFLKIKNIEFGSTKELELVTEEDDRISLDKQYPDLVYDISFNRAFLLNSKQAEYIIDLEVEITKTKKSFPDIQQKNKIFSEDSYTHFEEALNELNKTKVRKFVKMIENQTYEKFVAHREKATEIKNHYKFTIEFNECNEIVFSDETSMEDVLHLLSDDYVQSYLDEEAKVINQ
ncbi:MULTISPECIES: DUF4868 domain-containing protein [Leuconostoc]|uniref:DUF4868 domain-containing protein n=1 Tax=Leuconostoc gelidum subsp. gelidum TaxID=1607839 RepID=A0AB35FZF0_LEUGE|nr:MULTISPECIES: DUF4868 domain-containing protein [Leuconostoc]MBZ6016013.1 DUF4868 domain-containing protein [Leuconostoc gelidum subsp. gelidum]MCT3076468.1 DUF4868 domain-containing protein [Leuconostoc citreum]